MCILAFVFRKTIKFEKHSNENLHRNLDTNKTDKLNGRYSSFELIYDIPGCE